MRPPTSAPLAHAFLALADDGPAPDQRTLPRVLGAAIAAAVLALGGPLGWYAVKLSDDHPAAVLSSKSAFFDDE